MRRLLKTDSVNKSTEKKQHGQIIQSIALERTILESFKKEQESFVVEIEKVKTEFTLLTDKLTKEKSNYKKNTEKTLLLETEIKTLETTISTLELKLGLLLKEEVVIQMSLRKLQDTFNAEQKRINEESVISLDELSKKKSFLEKSISDLETKIFTISATEAQIGEEISTKLREKQSLDLSIANRMKELAQINKDLSSTKDESVKADKEFSEIDNKIKALKDQLLAEDKKIKEKTDEIALREKEIDQKRDELVAVMSHSKRIEEKAAAVRDLYKMAGIDVNL